MLSLLLACAADPSMLDPESAAEADMALAMLTPLRSWFLDSDRDGHGQPGTAILSRTRPPGHADTALDCDDDDPFTYPGVAYKEVRTTCKTDADGDGFGSMEPESGVIAGLDCDDDDATVSCVAEFEVGNAAEYGGESHHSPDYLLGSAFHLAPPGMTVTTLALIGKVARANVKMAVYNSDAAGDPDELMVATEPEAVPVGVLEIPVPATRLSAGTYWIMAVYDEVASVGEYARSAGDRPVLYRPLDFADPIPTTFGTPLANDGERFNYYALGY